MMSKAVVAQCDWAPFPLQSKLLPLLCSTAHLSKHLRHELTLTPASGLLGLHLSADTQLGWVTSLVTLPVLYIFLSSLGLVASPRILQVFTYLLHIHHIL